VQSVKKQMYLFHLPYYGKPARLNDWRRQVDNRTTQTLKFMNMARILRIIKYDPSLYMNAQKIHTIASGERPYSLAQSYQGKGGGGASAGKSMDPRASLIEATRKNNVSQNLF